MESGRQPASQPHACLLRTTVVSGRFPSCSSSSPPAFTSHHQRRLVKLAGLRWRVRFGGWGGILRCVEDHGGVRCRRKAWVGNRLAAGLPLRSAVRAAVWHRDPKRNVFWQFILVQRNSKMRSGFARCLSSATSVQSSGAAPPTLLAALANHEYASLSLSQTPAQITLMSHLSLAPNPVSVKTMYRNNLWSSFVLLLLLSLSCTHTHTHTYIYIHTHTHNPAELRSASRPGP